MVDTQKSTAEICGINMNEITFNTQYELFHFMREKARETCKYYQTDVAIDIEFILERKYEEPERDINFIWQVGEFGTHKIWLDGDNFSNELKAVYTNYSEDQGNKYYHLILTREEAEMLKIGKWYLINKEITICPNYGGWIITGENYHDYNIYRRYTDTINAYKKRKDGTNREEPEIIGKMTDEQYINALCDNE